MRVAVLGAGYAGLTLARRLERTLPATADLVVVDESRDHLVQHELHRVVRRPSLADDITVDLGEVLDCDVRQATVTSVDADDGVATLETADGEETLTYEVGAVCLGAETAFFDVPGLRAHATPLKRLDHAEQIREEFLALQDGDRLVVGGAGLSGVQVAGELVALAREESMDVEVRLLEQESEVAPTFDESFRRAVRDALDTVHQTLYDAAAETLSENVREADSRAEILGTVGQHGGYVAAPWCGDEACEEPIKSEIAAEVVAVPLDAPTEADGPGERVTAVHDESDTCALCDDPAETTAYFARTY